MYANKLVTTRRAIENKNTSCSQVMELGASNNPPDPHWDIHFVVFVVEGTHGSFEPMLTACTAYIHMRKSQPIKAYANLLSKHSSSDTAALGFHVRNNIGNLTEHEACHPVAGISFEANCMFLIVEGAVLENVHCT
eukprot:1142991-Pelagomonas_calceolata.AAC.1